MIDGNFYFFKDDYFRKFKDESLMKNREVINGKMHERPCY